MTADQDDLRSDGELLRAVAGGDREALQVLYDRHAPWLTVRLSRRCADPDIVEEVLQDTFVDVHRSARRWSGTGEVGAWIWVIGRRRLVDAFRRRRHRTIRITLDHQGGATASAEDEALLGLEYGDLSGALRRLSPELHAVVQLCWLDGFTTRQAARALKIPHQAGCKGS